MVPRRGPVSWLALLGTVGLLAACSTSQPDPSAASLTLSASPSPAPSAATSKAAAASPPNASVSAAAAAASGPLSDANAALLATIAAATPLPTPADARDDVTGSFDVGGYGVFLSCQGVGSPTVVLVHGSNGSADDWRWVQPELATFVRVCSYSRPAAGVGPQPRTIHTMVEELRTLLGVAGIAGPYLLVGHSWGGGVVRVYAQQYPADVAGLVLSDSVTEDPDGTQQSVAFLQAAIARGEQWALDEQTALDALFAPQTAWEGVDLEASVAQMVAVTSLGDLPLAVVTAGQYDGRPGWPQEYMALQARLHQEEQQALVGLSTKGFQRVATESGHFVPKEQPEAVVEAIRQVLEMAQ